MNGIQFQVKGQPVNFSPDDYAGLISGDAQVIWDIFTQKAREIYRNNEGKALGETCELSERGVAWFENILSEDDVLKLKSVLGPAPKTITIERSDEPSDNIPYTGKNVYTVKPMVFDLALRSQINRLIYKILNKKLVEELESYFQSFFSINHVMLSRAFPDPDPIVSFRWHRDAGPKMQTHIMVYLDDAEVTGGRTEFVDYQDSLELEKVYPIASSELDRRINDLSQIYPEASIIRPMPKAGDALIFNATQIFHQGIHPNRAFRDVLFIILQPDLQPWSKLFPSDKIFKFPSGIALYGHHPFRSYAVQT